MTKFIIPFLTALTFHLTIAGIVIPGNQYKKPDLGGSKTINIELAGNQVPTVPSVTRERLLPIPPRPVLEVEEKGITPESSPQNVVQTTPSKRHTNKQQNIKANKEKIVKRVAKQIASTQSSIISPESLNRQLQKPIKSTTNAALQQQSPAAPAAIQANPLYRQNPKPTYPPLARRRGWEGTVILLVTVNVLGESEKVSVLKSSGQKILDKSALKTVKKWIFTPGKLGVQPISMEVQVPVHFSIQ